MIQPHDSSLTSYFYDNKLGLHVNQKPLLVSWKVLQAAEELGIRSSLRWNEHGYICGVSYTMAKSLCRHLGIRMLSIAEFMDLAHRDSRVHSADFAEWLLDTFAICTTESVLPVLPETTLLLQPDSGDNQVLKSLNQGYQIPVARPGWFNIDDISPEGMPTKLSSVNELGLWKFWSLEDPSYICGAARSFVTSSGTCSLDLGIPIFARHPMMMIRECYPNLEIQPPEALLSAWDKYEQLTFARDDAGLKAFISSLELENLRCDAKHNKLEKQKYEEMLVDLRGKQVLLTQRPTQMRIMSQADLLATFEHDEERKVVYVIGHPRPDADVIVSALFEASRRKILQPDVCFHAWSECVPPEVRTVLGASLSDRLSQMCKPQNHHEIVLVDCADAEPQFMMNVRSVIDHHIISRSFPYYVALSQEVSWSTTIQVYIKILGSGMDLGPPVARILLEATRLEAEPSLMEHMSELDRLAIQRLMSIAEAPSSYEDLMSVMTQTTNPEDMFYKDYKESSYGFAVVKTRQQMDFQQQAQANNAARQLPVTIVKQVLYSQNFADVETETISITTNPKYHDKGFRSAIEDVVMKACRSFHGNGKISFHQGAVRIEQVQHQTPRLLLMPLIGQLVQEHLRFAYSITTQRYISMGFFTNTKEIYGHPDDVRLPQTDLSHEKIKDTLSMATCTSILSLVEYWKVYREFTEAKFAYAIKSLRDPHHVEVLDTLVYENQIIVHGSDLLSSDQKEPPAQRIYLPETITPARPALIHPDDADRYTGLPATVRSANNYDDQSLWRYWSPDSEHRLNPKSPSHGKTSASINVATRGHIFVMNQTCLDLKVRPNEATRFTTFRPVYRNIPDIKYEIEVKGNWVHLQVFPRLFSLQ